MRKRSNVKRKIGRFAAYVSNFENSKNYVELGNRKSVIECCLAEFEQFQEKIEMLQVDAVVNKDNADANEQESKIFKMNILKQ